jgi:SpoVK/Ycf46/Vps4 family AAA+-type ATPase
MASSEQLKALFKSHIDSDDQRFFSVAMQIAAHEAKLGHGKFAEELRSLIDSSKRHQNLVQPTPINRPKGELAGLLTVSYPKLRLSDMILSDTLEEKLQRIIREQRHADRILSHGLFPRRKLLLIGPPGTGKTMTASVLSGELGIPLFQVRLDGLITKYMGETAAKLRQIFEATSQTRGIYIFDEFDAIGSQRGLSNDVGEIRRVLNSFLQMIEQDQSHSLIIAATNHANILDHALFRRFDDVLNYELPSEKNIADLLKARLTRFVGKKILWNRLVKTAKGLSFAEINRSAEDVIKEALIHTREIVTEADIIKSLDERQLLAGRYNNNNKSESTRSVELTGI